MKDNPNYGNIMKEKTAYILDFKKNISTSQFEDLNSLVKQIVNNFYRDTNKQINILVRSNNYKVEVLKYLRELYDMHGKSLAGLSTFSKYQIQNRKRKYYKY